MKRTLVVLLMCALLAPMAFSQTFDFATFESGFNDFAASVAGGLAFNSTIGQHWSDAYIGQLPHLGFGVTAGLTTIPRESADFVFDTLGVDVSQYEQYISYGLPIPGYTADVRLGGIIFPFDAGIKVGVLPPEAQALLPDGFSIDYLNA